MWLMNIRAAGEMETLTLCVEGLQQLSEGWFSEKGHIYLLKAT